MVGFAASEYSSHFHCGDLVIIVRRNPKTLRRLVPQRQAFVGSRVGLAAANCAKLSPSSGLQLNGCYPNEQSAQARSGQDGGVLLHLIERFQHVVHIALIADQHVLLEQKGGFAQPIVVGKIVFPAILIQPLG